jgi:hypothetical protein
MDELDVEFNKQLHGIILHLQYLQTLDCYSKVRTILGDTLGDAITHIQYTMDELNDTHGIDSVK